MGAKKVTFMLLLMLAEGVADPGSGAFLTPGSRIRNRFFPDQLFKNKIFNFVKFVATKKGTVPVPYSMKTIFSPLSFVAVFGSGIRDG
jgi:hypothetical protein